MRNVGHESGIFILYRAGVPPAFQYRYLLKKYKIGWTFGIYVHHCSTHLALEYRAMVSASSMG